MRLDQPQTQRWLGYGAALLSGICAGVIWPLNKQLSAAFSPGQITWLQALVAVLLLLPWYAVRRRQALAPRGTPWVWLALFGLTAVMLFYMRTVGVALTNATTASLMVRIEIVLVVIYSSIFLRDRPTLWGWLGAVALVLGMLAALDLPAQQLRVNLWGVVALWLAGIGIAVNAIIIKLRLGRVSDELTALFNAFSQAAVLPLLLGPAGELSGFVEPLRTPRLGLMMLAGGAVIPTMLITYYYAMKRVPMWSVRLLGLVAPLVALVSDHFWLHSPLSSGQLCGFVLVTTGAALVIVFGTHPSPAPGTREVPSCPISPKPTPPSFPSGGS